jgi:hypothetical protein
MLVPLLSVLLCGVFDACVALQPTRNDVARKIRSLCIVKTELCAIKCTTPPVLCRRTPDGPSIFLTAQARRLRPVTLSRRSAPPNTPSSPPLAPTRASTLHHSPSSPSSSSPFASIVARIAPSSLGCNSLAAVKHTVASPRLWFRR